MDEIQRRLRDIDRGYAPGLELMAETAATSPLVFCALGLMMGILLANALPAGLWLWPALCGGSAAAALVLALTGKHTKQLPFLVVLVMVCFVGLGGTRLATFRNLQSNNIANLVGADRTLATIRGTVVSNVYLEDRNKWVFGKYLHTDPGSSFYLRVEQVQTPSGWAEACGTVRVQVKETVLDVAMGDKVQMYCWLSRFEPPGNPGEFDVAAYLARRNVFIAAMVQSRSGIELLRPDNPRSQSLLLHLRKKLSSAAADCALGAPLPQTENQGLLAALLLGHRSAVDQQTLNAFRRTGLLHFLSLSGLHVGILAGLLWWAGKLAGLSKRWRAAVCIIWLAAFVLVVPPRPPVLRAAIIGWALCAAILAGRRPNALNSLSLAAIILLIYRPAQIFSAGWQLSFATVLGILLFAERFQNLFFSKLNFLHHTAGPNRHWWLSRAAGRIAAGAVSLFAVGLAAWLGGAGILLYHFHRVTPMAPLWTVLIFPLVALLLTAGFLNALLALLVPALATAGAVITDLLSGALITVVRAIDSLQISGILLGHIAGGVIIGFYALVISVGMVHLPGRWLKRILCGALSVTVAGFAMQPLWQPRLSNSLEITCLSVGHGQAIVARTPGGRTLLFDTGSLSRDDCGNRVANAFLDWQGTRRIDALLISHDDIDHINGLPEVVTDRPVKHIFANEAFLASSRHRSTAAILQEHLAGCGLKLTAVPQVMQIGDVNLRMLWPDEQACNNPEFSDNDKSQVVVIEYAGRKILLCADIQQFAQNRILQAHPQLRADVMVAPHHGSANSLSEDFLQQIDPAIIICSCGRRQYEEYVFGSDAATARCYYTARDGAVIVSVDNKGQIEANTARKRRLE